VDCKSLVMLVFTCCQARLWTRLSQQSSSAKAVVETDHWRHRRL